MRRFYVTMLVEVYHEDGGESMRQRGMEVEIEEPKPGEKESFEQLSRKLEPVVNERLPKRQCVNYIQDIEYRGTT